MYMCLDIVFKSCSLKSVKIMATYGIYISNCRVLKYTVLTCIHCPRDNLISRSLILALYEGV